MIVECRNGYRQIGYFGNSLKDHGKYAAFQETLRQHGVEIDESRIMLYQAGAQSSVAIRCFLEKRPQCDALFFVNYATAMAFVYEAKDTLNKSSCDASWSYLDLFESTCPRLSSHKAAGNRLKNLSKLPALSSVSIYSAYPKWDITLATRRMPNPPSAVGKRHYGAQ